MCLESNTTQPTAVSGSMKENLKIMDKAINPKLPINKTQIKRKPDFQEEFQTPQRVEITEKGIIFYKWDC